MNISDVLVVIGGIIVLFMILKFIGKVVARIISFILIVGFVLYVLFFWRGGVLDLGNRDFMLVEIQHKYCEEENYDAVKCNCIIEPVYEDIKSRYSNNEIVELQANKIKSLKVIIKSLNDNKEYILECLKENESLEKWDEFIYELEDFDIKKELQEKWREIRNE